MLISLKFFNSPPPPNKLTTMYVSMYYICLTNWVISEVFFLQCLVFNFLINNYTHTTWSWMYGFTVHPKIEGGESPIWTSGHWPDGVFFIMYNFCRLYGQCLSLIWKHRHSVLLELLMWGSHLWSGYSPQGSQRLLQNYWWLYLLIYCSGHTSLKLMLML